MAVLDEHGIDYRLSNLVEELTDAVYEIAHEQGHKLAWVEAQRELDGYRAQAWETLTDTARELHRMARTIPGQELRVPAVYEPDPEVKAGR